MSDASEHVCGNCDEPSVIDHDGDRVQPCDNCNSPEMVKELGNL